MQHDLRWLTGQKMLVGFSGTEPTEELRGLTAGKRSATLEASGSSCKTAIVMLLLGLDAQAANAVLAEGGGHIARALACAKRPQP